MSLDILRKKYSTCTLCPALCESRTQVVFGEGNPESKILFIGEAPGASEDAQGVPFVGMAGKVLSELLAAVGLTRQEIFITNTILCRPKDNRNPAKEEVENCSERLDQLIAIMQPKVIVTIGNFATDRILRKKGITSIHGKVFETVINNVALKVVPVIHPANYLYQGRNPQLFEEMKKDFRTIAGLVHEQKVQRSLGEF